ncbi:MAG: transglutaminase-like domain-containing protein [Planctomycetaceae bacterium]
MRNRLQLHALAFVIGAALATTAHAGDGAESSAHPAFSDSDLLRAAESAGLRVKNIEIDAPAVVRSNLDYKTSSYDDPRLVSLRKKYQLEKVVAGAADEWTAQRLLRNWVHERIPNGTPRVKVRHAEEILDAAATGEKFWCTYYAISMAECAQSLGWQCRKIAIGRLHEPETKVAGNHHGITEIWSNQFGKWIAMDAHFDFHTEKNGVPLSAWEVRAEWLKDGGKSLDHMAGPPATAAKKPQMRENWRYPGEDESSTFFWIYYEDHAIAPEGAGTQRLIFPQDAANAGRTWFQRSGEIGEPGLVEHIGYRKKRFLPTERIEDVYWTVGVVEIREASGDAKSRAIRLALDSHCPNRIGYEVARDGGEWSRLEGDSATWKPKSGTNTLQLRTLSAGDVKGPVATLQLEVE